MFSAISKVILWILGWKVEVNYPADLKKYVVIAVPHTSSWDFPLGLLVRSAINRDIKFIGKHTLFKPPFGWIFRALGGYPVNREKSTNFVKAVVKIYEREDEFACLLAPEGTRKKVDKLKTGFYFIAKRANIPVIMVKFDFGNKKITFSEPFYTTDDQEADFAFIDNYFRGTRGKRPERSYKYNMG